MKKEQIEKKAKEFKVNDICCVWNGGCPNVYNAAMEMANWLLDNLWISVENELPPFDETVIVHYDNGVNVGEMFSERTEDVNVVKDNHDFCIYCDEIITHWMSIPKLNKK